MFNQPIRASFISNQRYLYEFSSTTVFRKWKIIPLIIPLIIIQMNLLQFIFLPLVQGCVPTGIGGEHCCLPLVATPSNTSLSDGIMSFEYNSLTCRTTVTASCSKPATTLEQVQAAIKVNQVSLLSVGIDTATTNGFCDVNRRWTMGTTPIMVESIQCVLSTLA
ncbi:unnamed protein product [Dracunculus medinensis]|uniref:Hydrophobin n=1 Tax=Dracunculus medinensis TaxID=318479 RepID=A0A0N4UEQ5_DRAME|nr:unnamed protein product [Dracunculus medinensis]